MNLQGFFTYLNEFDSHRVRFEKMARNQEMLINAGFIGIFILSFIADFSFFHVFMNEMQDEMQDENIIKKGGLHAPL